MLRVMIVIGLAVLAGCALTPMEVDLAPDTAVSASDAGYGQTVYLTVYDERTSKNVGNRGTGGGGIAGAPITLDDDLSAVVQSAVSDMLVTKGFTVAYEQPDNPHSALRLDIRGLNYQAFRGRWTGGVEVTAALKASAHTGIEDYENFYRYDNEDRVHFDPSAKSNNERINMALNSVLHQAINDRKLIEVLSRR